MRFRMLSALAAMPLLLPGGVARADDAIGKPWPGGIALQPAVTPVAHSVHWMDDFLLIIATAITLFVVGLIGYVVFRFNEKANPEPATFSHNSVIEVIWTAVPVLILIVIAIPSLKLLFLQLDVPDSEVTIKATGNKWFWSYEYPDDGISFDAVIVGGGYRSFEALQADKDAWAEAQKQGMDRDNWLLLADNHVVVPVGKNVHVLVTGADVIHSWAMPAFGAKIDAVPGRINETWFRVEKEGRYYGQCSELCGMNHAYMPITVDAVSPEQYDAWKAEQQAKARGDTEVAVAQ